MNYRNFLIGFIYNLRSYDRVLSAAEIAAIYKQEREA